jgi:membrane fusion protein (multidrug efflux system)
MFFATVLGIGILFSFSGCNNSLQSENSHEISSSPHVDVYVVKSQAVPLIQTLPGRTAAFNVAEVRPQVNGIILKRKFKEGAFVKEGDELYEINDEVYQAHFNKEIANLKFQERELQRMEKLKESKAIAAQEYENVLYSLEKAKADVRLAQLNLDYCKVKAPLSGKIGYSMISVGALVTNGQPNELAVIQQIDPIYVDLNPAVPQILQNQNNHLPKESPSENPNPSQHSQPQNSSNNNKHELPFWQDAAVTLMLEDGSRYPHSGKIKFLDNRVQEDTGTVLLRAEIPNPDGILLPGMFVRASVTEGIRQNAKLIPQQSLFRDNKGNPYVWIVRPDNTTEMRFVKVERVLGNTYLIDNGIEEGDQVVVEGSQFIKQDINVIPKQTEHPELKISFE